MDWLGRFDLPAHWRGRLPPWLTGILVGVFFCALSLLLRIAVQSIWPTVVPYGLLFPMILLATLVGRWIGGLTCLTLGALIIWFSIRPALAAAGLPAGGGASVLILYFVAAGTMLLIAEFFRRAQDALRQEQTLRAEAETEHQRMLAQELGHRLRNLLTTVQAIAMQTLDTSEVDRKARQAFNERLMALARVHDLLTQADWSTIALDQLTIGAVTPFEDGNRFNIEGPAVALVPRHAIAVALALHELATNALKYGALSTPDGRVGISWRVNGSGFHLTWVEQGGPAVERPTRSGFGTRLLQRNLARELDGEVVMNFAPDGLLCEIKAPSLQPK